MLRPNKRYLLFLLVSVWAVLPLLAQSVSVEGFKKLHRNWLLQKSYTTDKQHAVLDFFTAEKGFTFMANGNTPVEAQEGEGCLTLLVPHRTRFILITHDKFGQVVWKVPLKYLKKKKHYQAQLLTFTPDEEYTLQKQWVVFRIHPEKAWLQVDSAFHTPRKGVVELFLPVGKHTYRVEAPFFDTVQDTIELTENGRLEVEVSLSPSYSFLNVYTPYPDAEIRVDGVFLGNYQACSNKLSEGRHKVEVTVGDKLLCTQYVHIGRGEMKNLSLTVDDFQPYAAKPAERMPDVPVKIQEVVQQESSPEHVPTKAMVLITAPQADTEILINRDYVGKGSWQGELPEGTYALQSRQEGVDSPVYWLKIIDSRKKEITLPVPYVACGMISISSNVTDAEVWVDGKLRGLSPCVIGRIPAGKACQVMLRKDGYKESYKKIIPQPNSLMEVEMKMKKK